MLQAGVVAGTALWVAPVIDSLSSPAAALSCTGAGGTIDWTLASRPNGAPANVFPWVVTGGPFGGTTVTFELPTAGALVWGGANESGVQKTFQQGGITGLFNLFKNNAPSGNVSKLRISLNRSVRNLDFRIMDIDIAVLAGNNFTDQVLVELFNNITTPVSGTFTPDSLTPSFTPTGAATATSDTRTGNAAAPAGNNTGNLRIQVPGPVDTVDITYTSAQVGTATTQAISLSNITWTC